jgi:hypothetical protein
MDFPGFADRFRSTRFDGDIRSRSGSSSTSADSCAPIAYRLTLAAQMVRQYPWLYQRFLLWLAPRRSPYN